MSTEVLEELLVDSHHFVLTSEGIVPGPSGTFIRRSHRTVGSKRSAKTDPFPPLPSDLPMPQLTTWLLSSDSPVSPASLRQGLHNFPSFEGSSDLWILRLDGIPMRCNMPRSMFDHPHSLFSEYGVLRKLKHIFPNTYQRIKSICSPAKGGTGCYRFNYQPGS